jgi:hypothetical protein
MWLIQMLVFLFLFCFLFLINFRSVVFFNLAATNKPENVKAICENTLVLYVGVCREVFRKLKRRARNRVATSARRGMTFALYASNAQQIIISLMCTLSGYMRVSLPSQQSPQPQFSFLVCELKCSSRART